jgi:threonine dehydrogenase-like Zn-dependent dehydrogenase
MLVYRGEVDSEMELDKTITALQGNFQYPFSYGYSSVGHVVQVGLEIPMDWLGRQVFSFHPHQSAFLARLSDLIPIPETVDLEDAVFLPNMETAVNFVMDGRPMVGEIAAVFGLGIVGLLTTSLLAQFPLGGLVCFDRFKRRRDLAQMIGCSAAIDPQDGEDWHALREDLFPRIEGDGFDLCFELSGSPAALDRAIKLTGYSGRVVVGSWYGTKSVNLALGGRFHRSRIQVMSSQVSSLAPELLGRWSKERRFKVAWDQLSRLKPSKWITQRFPLERAGEAYRLLAEMPQDTLQVIFDYRDPIGE